MIEPGPGGLQLGPHHSIENSLHTRNKYLMAKKPAATSKELDTALQTLLPAGLAADLAPAPKKVTKKTSEPTIQKEGKNGIVYTFPATFGGMADRLYLLGKSRLVQQKLADVIEEEEKALKAHLIATMPKDDTGGMGRLARVSLGSKEVPQVKDWEAFQKYILKTKNFAFLQKRVGEAMVKEIWDSGKAVPGVEPFTVITVSLNKI
jgi:hypothetical protein